MKRLAALALAALCAIAAPLVQAQKFPDKPIRFIVPFPPGGGNDILARVIAPKMAESLGQPVVIDNRAGAGGNIGTDIAAKSAPDGYTIVIASNQVTMNPALYAKLPFDIEKDFAPIALAASVPMVLVVHPSVPAGSVKELIALAKAEPGKLNYSTPGNGTPQHIAFEVFNHAAGISIAHVPYKGTGPAIADVIGGQVQAAFGTMASLEQHVKAGKLRALAVATPKRSPAMPDCADHGRVRLAGLRRFAVVLDPRAGRNAEGDRRADLGRHRENARAARGARPPCRAGVRSHLPQSRADERPHEARHRALGKIAQGRRHQARLRRRMSLNQALAGIRVLDFAQVGAGPLCGMQLGDLGADVIKIESPAGDLGRKLGPPWQEGESVVSMSFNRNKRSLVIDMKKPPGGRS